MSAPSGGDDGAVDSMYGVEVANLEFRILPVVKIPNLLCPGMFAI
jgi:hypothetical protein